MQVVSNAAPLVEASGGGHCGRKLSSNRRRLGRTSARAPWVVRNDLRLECQAHYVAGKMIDLSSHAFE
jgi:hypothetical protein